MKKQSSRNKKHEATPVSESNSLNWKKRREILSNAIAMEVDLENRQIFFEPGIKDKLRFDFGTNNVDNLIKTYLDPKELRKINRSLTEAKKGREKPIPFNFVHPLTSRTYRFEYHYQIVYVKYASTRLHGELIKAPDEKLKKTRAAKKTE